MMYRVKAYQSDEAESTIFFEEFPIIRETPKGYVIRFYRYKKAGDTNERWVPKDCKNAFSFTDKKAALNNFYFRQLRQWKINICRKIRVAVKTMLDTDSLVKTKVSQYDEESIV